MLFPSKLGPVASRISKLLLRRSKRKQPDSPFLLSPKEHSQLQALLSHPDFRLSYPRCFEPLLEVEAAKILAAKNEVEVMVALGRLQLLESLLHWPERLAAMNKEYYDDRAKRDRAVATDADPRSAHLGSPYWRSDFERAATAVPDSKRPAGG